MVIVTVVLMISLLILANALYVAAEFGAVSVRRSKIQQLAEEGHRLAKRMLPIVEDPEELDRYIAASQIGITLSSLILGAYGQAQLAPILVPLFEGLGGMQTPAAHSTSAAILLITLTVAQMILGELVPKSVALQFPNQTTFFTALPMGWSLRVFRPFIWLLNGSGLAILRLFGVSHSVRHVHSPEEIRLLIHESTEGGMLAPEERRQLNRALELGARKAGDVMVPADRIISIDVDASVDELFRLAISSPYTRMPVRKGTIDTVVGIIHTKDITQRLMTGKTISAVKEVMRPALSVNENVRADRLLALLREHHLQQAIVTGKGGAVVGLVSLEDVLAHVFGQLPDEFKSGAFPQGTKR
jgi:CBS domain containing-hemolysin-like protein